MKPKKGKKKGFAHPTSQIHHNAQKVKKSRPSHIQIIDGESYDITSSLHHSGHAHSTHYNSHNSLHHHQETHHHGHHVNPFQNNRVSKILSQIIPNAERNQLVSSSQEWKRLQKHAEYIRGTHLRDLLKNHYRSEALYATHDGVYLDYARNRITLETMKLLYDLAKKQNLKGKIEAMTSGEKINNTEKRAVLHTALRASRDQIGSILVDDVDAVAEVHDVLDQIEYFSNAIRSGEIRGYTGKRLRNIISVGIGGSYLGPEFLHECLKTEPEGINSSLGYTLRFLSNVDPVNVERACADLDPEETLIVIVSKTFTTAETMLNARTMRQWLWDFMGNDAEVVRKHVVACASISALEKVEAFGIDTENYFFRFWDWVGGRYSVCSAVGGIPISLQYGFELFEKFLLVSLHCLSNNCNHHRFMLSILSNIIFNTLGSKIY